MPDRPIVIVDPYSSGALLADALVARGVRCIAVESSPALPTSMRSHFDRDAFGEVISHHGDGEQTLQSVARHKPSRVIAGFESGVELSEWLGHQLGLPSNDPNRAESRRDKYAMAESARSRGLRTPLQFQSCHIDDLLAWTHRTLAWPVIAKPPQSVASDHVFCCRTSDELRSAAEAILRDRNVLGSRNSTVLVQEFLPGTEYAVDTVSCDGKHKLTAIWQYHRPAAGSTFICYDSLRLLPYEGDRQAELRRFAFAVLDAVGVRFGPAHGELIWTAEGPALIEVGARMTAGNNAVLSRLCGGICQLDETVEVLVAPDRFLAGLDSQPRLEKWAANLFLIAPCRGRLIQTRHLERLRQLPTLHSMSIATQVGEVIQGVAGRVTLLHASWEAIERDLEEIRSLEKKGIFLVEEQPHR